MGNYNERQRVGILTFHRAINYGALLQAYALQEALKKMGCLPEIIDYRSPVLESQHLEARLSNCQNAKDIARFIFYAKHQNRKMKIFRDFSAANLNLSDVYENTEQLRKISLEYDKFICGSDQVWNHRITDFDRNYFLDFIEDIAKKNSYAASFGISSIPPEHVNEYRNLLKGFNHISVRENQGRKIINELVNREAELVLDPTLLLSKQDWESIAADYKKKKNYILLYMFGNSLTMKTFVENLARQTGCEIVLISYSVIKRINATYEKSVGPAEFLGLFQNARYVVTNSFHGTCFSLNFNKDFFLEMLPESQGVNSRLENILDLFDLRSRQIISGENANTRKTIDYGEVNKRLLVERQRSLDFISKIISN